MIESKSELSSFRSLFLIWIAGILYTCIMFSLLFGNTKPVSKYDPIKLTEDDQINHCLIMSDFIGKDTETIKGMFRKCWDIVK